jgi:short-subunit dehydrogenase
VSEITQNGGEWHTLDVDSATAASKLISKLESAGYKIDVLVNNAGYAIIGAVEQFSDGELRAQMETVYFGPSRLIGAVVPGMRERQFGVVVNVSSGAGLEGRESMGAYAAAKAAMDGKFLYSSLLLLVRNVSRLCIDLYILQVCVKCSLKKSHPSMSAS